MLFIGSEVEILAHEEARIDSATTIDTGTIGTATPIGTRTTGFQLPKDAMVVFATVTATGTTEVEISTGTTPSLTGEAGMMTESLATRTEIEERATVTTKKRSEVIKVVEDRVVVLTERLS